MVATRTKTGVLATQKYDRGTLKMNETILSTLELTKFSPRILKPEYRTKGPRSPSKGSKNSKQGHGPKGSSKSVKFNAPNNARERSPLGTDVAHLGETLTESLAPCGTQDVCDGVNFFPKVVFGEREEVGKSKIQRANREIEMWEEVLKAHKVGLPGLVPLIEERVMEAVNKRQALADTEENHRVGDINPGKRDIKERLEILEWALETSKFEPESENIRGAIEAYKSGEIGHSNNYTLIYAGKVVDTAATYSDFVMDRQERLDRYAAQHGPHWLWYEPPLNVHPETKPMLGASAALPRSAGWNSMGPYHVTQGFWKRAGWVRRLPQQDSANPSPMEAKFARREDGTVYCQNEGPKLCFRSLLDSGATFPTLYKEDLESLGIDGTYYAAQSVMNLTTASGSITTRIFDLFVAVLDDNGKQLVDENDAVWPQHPKYLGGLCPVTENFLQLRYDSNGMEENTRLSGILPFLACYISSTPTQNSFHLGENRNDVLGSHRMPGQMKWEVSMADAMPLRSVTWDKYGDPKTTFSHRDGQIVDRDHPTQKHKSVVTFLGGTDQETVIVNDPRVGGATFALMKEIEKRANNPL